MPKVHFSRKRAIQFVFVMLAALTCLGLAWWQFDRYKSATGTGQNLGYALQWPMFGLFFLYTYRRIIQLDKMQEKDDQPNLPSITHSPTSLPYGLLPERKLPPKQENSQDFELTTYNKYLQELAEQETKTHG